jgi:hypothetical protein
MALSMYEIAVPTLAHTLTCLSKILAKAADYATAKKIDPAVLVNARLAPDMFPLSRQVQIASDTAKGCAARLANREPPSYPDTEATLLELIERLDKTVEFMHSIPAAEIDGSETRKITLNMRSGPLHFSGREYLLAFVLPNVYFHVATAYGILRHNGLDIGKRDYLGQS